jgi:hypothetical protein
MRILPSTLVLLAVSVLRARASTFVVDRTDDSASATACTAAADDCSLRGAIIAANAHGGADEVDVPAGTYTLTLAGRAEDAAATGDLDVTDDLTIVGTNNATTIVDANGIDRSRARSRRSSRRASTTRRERSARRSRCAAART